MGVEIVRPPVGHRHPPGEDVVAEQGLKDHERGRLAGGRPRARLPRDQGRRLAGRHERRGVDVDPLVKRAEDRDGHPARELPGHASAHHRNALVVLPEALVDALRQQPVGGSGRENQLVGPRQRVDQLVGPAQLRHPGLGHRDLAAAGRFLPRQGDNGKRQRGSGNEWSDGVLGNLHG